MKAWPKAFEYDVTLRKAFCELCELLTYYKVTRDTWHPDIPVWDANFVWKTAIELLNY